MMRIFQWTLLFLFAVLVSTVMSVGEGKATQTFAVKPSDVGVPTGSELGNYQRVIRPFENWDLICDEDLVSMQKICNVTQSIVDSGGQLVFGWSLAATETGDPVMILRTRPDAVATTAISLHVPGYEKPVVVKINACAATVCTAFLPVGELMREQIGRKATISIAYSTTESGTIDVKAPLAGLSSALQSIE